MDALRRRAPSPKISMYVRHPLHAWWAYLGIKSDPTIVAMIDDRFDRAIFFDDPLRLPAPSRANQSGGETKYFYIFWDGVSDERAIEDASLVVGRGADLIALVVGDFSRVSQKEYRFRALYRQGDLDFGGHQLRFDARTTAMLVRAKIRAAVIPLKNLSQCRGRFSESIGLLFGKKRVVFCGSFGTTPRLVEVLCDRHSVNRDVFKGYEYYCNDLAPSLENYKGYLRNNVLFLAGLHGQSLIDSAFLRSAIRLLGREYFIEKIRSAGFDIFVNEGHTGSFVDVYTTPFYSQHVFLDFGSVVGPGNYPRLADLRYFKKNVVEIEMTGEIEELLALAGSGMIEKHFERKWELKSPQIRRLMAESR